VKKAVSGANGSDGMKVTGNTTTRHDDGDGQHNNLVKMAAR